MKRLITTILILFLLCGCDLSTSENIVLDNKTENNDQEYILIKGLTYLTEAEDMVDRIFQSIEYLQFYKIALENNDKQNIELYGMKSCDIMGCGLHLWYDTSYEDSMACDIRDTCEIIGVDFDKYYAYLTDIDSRISQLIDMHQMLEYYEQTQNKYFFDEFDIHMENVQLWLENVNDYDWSIPTFEVKYKLLTYIEELSGEKNETN